VTAPPPPGERRAPDAAGDREEGRIAALERLAARLERVNLAAYVDLYRNPRRMLVLNFAAGLARGLGMAVGFTVLGALVVYLLGNSFVHNLPVIGRLVAQIVRIVQQEGARRG
jgi:hypothetical protein